MNDPKANPSLTYRPALDGIRAFAVLAVLAYHLGLPMARGGFLGVDVFFVLSGYLITSLLLLEYEARGRIDLVRFWIRRARRLLPALLLVLLVVALWVNGTAAPFELSQRRQDLFWALFYGSNWHLISSAQDYFAGVASASMLRHTWSLAIEEQFYLLWPLIVFGALRLARGRERVVALVCGVGIGASVAAMALLFSSGDPSRAYYGTDARIHQLLIGALLAVAMIRVPSIRSTRPAGSAVAAVAALVLLVGFAMLGDTAAAYYGGLSVLIALAAATLIWGLEVAPHGAPGRFLSLGPCRWVGTISYGLYLWHWPVVVAVTAPAAAFAWLPGIPRPLGHASRDHVRGRDLVLHPGGASDPRRFGAAHPPLDAEVRLRGGGPDPDRGHDDRVPDGERWRARGTDPRRRGRPRAARVHAGGLRPTSGGRSRRARRRRDRRFHRPVARPRARRGGRARRLDLPRRNRRRVPGHPPPDRVRRGGRLRGVLRVHARDARRARDAEGPRRDRGRPAPGARRLRRALGRGGRGRLAGMGGL